MKFVKAAILLAYMHSSGTFVKSLKASKGS